MERVIGFGGIFFKADNPKALSQWYKKHLGVPIDETYGGYTFDWKSDTQRPKKGYTIWSPFKSDTDYINPSKKEFMFNFIVADLPKLFTDIKTGRHRSGRRDGRYRFWQVCVDYGS